MSGELTHEEIKRLREVVIHTDWLMKNYESEKRTRDSIPSLIELRINDNNEKLALKLENKLHDFIKNETLDKVESSILNTISKGEENCDLRLISLETSRTELNGFLKISKWIGGIIIACLAIFGITLTFNHG